MPTIEHDAATFVQSVAVTLTDAEIKALPTTPITIIPDPGAGRLIQPFAASNDLSIVGAYTNVAVGSTVGLYRGSMALQGIGIGPMRADNALTAGSDNGGAITLRASNASAGAFTGGNVANRLTIVVWYSVVSV